MSLMSSGVLVLNIFHKCSSVFVVDFQQVQARWNSSDHFDARLNTLCKLGINQFLIKLIFCNVNEKQHKRQKVREIFKLK